MGGGSDAIGYGTEISQGNGMTRVAEDVWNLDGGREKNNSTTDTTQCMCDA